VKKPKQGEMAPVAWHEDIAQLDVGKVGGGKAFL
jgi:hypothetical protein